MTFDDTKTDAKTKTYHYDVTLTGEGGEFWYIPMTVPQSAFWMEKGADALTEHLDGAHEDDGTPSEFKLGHYEDFGVQTGGLDLAMYGELIVRDESGTITYETTLEDAIDARMYITTRVLKLPKTGACFRSHERSEWNYSLELAEPLNPLSLRLRVTDMSGLFLVNGLFHGAQEVEPSMEVDKEWAMHRAELTS